MNAKINYEGQDVSQILRLAFYQLKATRSSLSLRQFSKKLGIQAPIISEVINNKRKVSYKLAQQILYALNFDQSKMQEVLKHYHQKSKRARKRPEKETLNQETIQVISEWWHLAILSMSESADPELTSEQIAKRLNIPLQKVTRSIEVLKKLRLIEVGKFGIRSTGRSLKTTSDIPSIFIQNQHRQGLELAQDSLTKHDVQQRHFSALILHMKPDQLSEAKKTFARFRRAFEKKFETKKTNTEVYRLQIQLFPLTQTEEGR